MKTPGSKTIIGVLCFASGIGATLLEQRVLPKAPVSRQEAKALPEELTDPFLAGGLFGKPADPFAQMRRIQRQMMREKFSVGDAGNVKRREDKDFVYYDIAIQGLDKDKLNVKVADGQISISGQTENKSEDSSDRAYFHSAFHRSFPVPGDADADRVQIEQSEGHLTLKFPRLQESA